MHKLVVTILIASAPLTTLQAQAMPVSTFLAKAEALKKKGPMALFSSDIGKLKAEIGNSGKAVRADQIAARKAGRKPAICMPPKAVINSDELLTHFHAIPAAQQRSMTVKAGFASLLAKKYPCPS